MLKRYLVVSFLGGLIGAGCVLVAVYVTNTKALVIEGPGIDAVSSVHSRINDFYIFAGIVITLLLAINVGVFVRADEEVDKQIKESFGKHEETISDLVKKCENLYSSLSKKKDSKTVKQSRHEPYNPEIDSQL